MSNWTRRDSSFPGLRRFLHGIHGAKFGEDDESAEGAKVTLRVPQRPECTRCTKIH